MAIKDDNEFQGKLAQLTRMYQGMRELWRNTDPNEAVDVQKWVIAGRTVVGHINLLLAELEDYTGTAELRLILNEFETIKRDRAEKAEKT